MIILSSIKKINMFKSLVILLSCFLYAGCVNTAPPLYQWEEYQAQVYAYLKGDGKSQEEQIITLEKGLQKIQAQGKATPPGYHAHLGLLYLVTGKEDQAIQQFETEKTLFPESAKFMDFLLRKTQKKG